METFPWAIGLALESTSSPNLCNLSLDGGPDSQYSPILAMRLKSRSRAFPVSPASPFWSALWWLNNTLTPSRATDDSRERLLHAGGHSAWLRKTTSCSSTGQNSHCPCSPAVPPLTPERQAPLRGSRDHWICRSIHKADVQAGLCLCACRPMWAGRSRDHKVLGPHW